MIRGHGISFWSCNVCWCISWYKICHLVEISTDPGGKIYILGIAMFVVSSRGIKCVIGMAIATYLGEKHFFLVLQCLSVHHMISNLLPPYRFLHDEHYIDYIITFFLWFIQDTRMWWFVCFYIITFTALLQVSPWYFQYTHTTSIHDQLVVQWNVYIILLKKYPWNIWLNSDLYKTSWHNLNRVDGNTPVLHR